MRAFWNSLRLEVDWFWEFEGHRACSRELSTSTHLDVVPKADGRELMTQMKLSNIYTRGAEMTSRL